MNIKIVPLFSLQTHVKNVHSVPSPFKCTESLGCGLAFGSAGDLRQHLSLHQQQQRQQQQQQQQQPTAAAAHPAFFQLKIPNY